MQIKTWTPKASEIERQWWVVDANGQTLGRVASQVAALLRGKHKPTFTTHMDTGDFVIVVNADKITVTGRRLDQKFYYRHSGYHGGIKSVMLRTQLQERPTRVLEAAIRGMLPKTSLGRQQLGKLKIYAGESHPHAAQKPQLWEIKS
jgi:large subunit ribosomal protein L13